MGINLYFNIDQYPAGLYQNVKKQFLDNIIRLNRASGPFLLGV